MRGVAQVFPIRRLIQSNTFWGGLIAVPYLYIFVVRKMCFSIGKLCSREVKHGDARDTRP